CMCFNYHIFCRIPAAQIRFLAVPALHEKYNQFLLMYNQILIMLLVLKQSNRLVMKLSEHIDLFFDGNKSAFAKSMSVTPQQVTKWVNDDWIIVDGTLYSPRRDLARGNMMERKKFLASIFSGAQYALAELREHNAQGPNANGIAQNARNTIELLAEFFKKENYHIYIIAYNNKTQQYEIYSSESVFELGVTYFHIFNPGTILFSCNNDMKSEETFEVPIDPSRLVANRFDPYAFTILRQEIQQALSQ
ncbi:hypothetical protein DT821_17840, partial [Salmonella enterica]|nr:hypothetical protein [Salmonella enterica]